MRVPLKYFWIAVGLIVAIGCDEDSGRDALSKTSSVAQDAANSMDKIWVNLNNKAEKLDVRSSLNDLQNQKEDLTGQIVSLKEKSGSEYELLMAQYKRLDAAERLKRLEADMDKLKETGKSIESTADKASQGLDEARKAYQSAEDKYTQIKQRAEKATSGL